MPEKRVRLCRLHPDFHLPADVEVGAGFDGGAYARKLKQCGVDAVAFFGKCHYGHSYYPTKVGTVHPKLKYDMLGEVVRGCREHDLGVVVYYSVFLDSVAAEKHPEWRLQATSSETAAGFDSGNFQPVCVNSGYIEELLLPQSIEIVSNYDVDELFYDTMTGFKPCYCAACRRQFGKDIPESADDPNWLEYVAWYAACYERFFAETARVVREARPGCGVLFNWKWGIREPVPPPPDITRLAADLICTGSEAVKHGRYFAGTGYPFDYMTGRFVHGLGDWNSNTPVSVRYAASTTVANGGGFYIIDRQLPDGSLEERSYEMMREVFGFLQERRGSLVGCEHVAETAVLYANSHLCAPDLRYFPDPRERQKRMQTFEGAVRMLAEKGRHFTALGAERLRERINDYRLLIIPEQEFLDAETKKSIRDWVQRGGKLLLTQSESAEAIDGEMLSLAGVEYQAHTELKYSYFGTEPPFHLRGRFANVSLRDGAETLCPQVRPLSAGKGGAKFGHGFAPPGEVDTHPAVVSHRVGKGEVIYIAAPVFSSYINYQDPAVARLTLGYVDRLLPDPLVRCSTPAQVEMVAMRQDTDLVVHLVNHSGRERLGGYFYPVTEYMPEIRGIQVEVRLPNGSTNLIREPSGEALAGREQDGYLCFTAPPLEFLETVRLPGYFSK